MTANAFTEIHHGTGPSTTRVSFDLHVHDEGTPEEFGVLCVEVTTSNGRGTPHRAMTKHFFRGTDWRERALAVRQAFRTATILPDSEDFFSNPPTLAQ